MLRFRVPLTLVAVACLLSVQPITSQTSVATEQLNLSMPQGTRTGTLRMPQGARRAPIVMLVSGGNPDMKTGLVEALGSRGFASLRVDVKSADGGATDEAAREIAGWITRLRNDARFERIMVAGAGIAGLGAARAARAARADGVILLGPAPPAPGVIKGEAGSIPVTVEVADDVVDRVVMFVNRTSIPRHPESERRSPRDTVMAEVDGSRLSIEYGRPSKRGRVIWGSLVPWGRWWMPGADEATTFTTSKAIAFGNLSVPAGDYTIYTQPSESTLQLIVNKETGVFHTVYRPERDLGHVEMQRSAPASPPEQLTFVIDAREGGGALKLIWDDREYVAPFVVGR